MRGRRACPQCIPGPAFDDQVSSLERRWGDTDVPPQELSVNPSDWASQSAAPLTDVLDWLGRSEINDPSFSPLPVHDPAEASVDHATSSSSAVKPLSDVLDWLGQSDLRDPTFTQLPMELPVDEPTDEAPQANSAHPTYGPTALPRLQPRTLNKAMTTTDTHFQQAVGDQPLGSTGLGHEGLGLSRSSVGPAPSPSWNARRTRDENLPFDAESDNLCMAAGAVCRSNGNVDEGRWSIEEEEEVEWHQRQQRTGTVGRLVQYSEGDRPKEDILLRGGTGAHVVVAAVRDGGPASKVGVKAGDRLVSIDGSKAFFNLPADTIREQLKSPTVLVFLGFVGKLQAEVRLSCSNRICGLNTQQSALLNNEHESHFKIAEERIFSTSNASLFLFTSTDGFDDRNGFSDSVSKLQDDDASQNESVATTIDTSLSRRLLFELQRPEATTILRRAMLGSHARDNDHHEGYAGYSTSFSSTSVVHGNNVLQVQPVLMNNGANALGGRPGRHHNGAGPAQGDVPPASARGASPEQAAGLPRERLGAARAGSPPLPEMASKDMGVSPGVSPAMHQKWREGVVPTWDGNTSKPISPNADGDEIFLMQGSNVGTGGNLSSSSSPVGVSGTSPKKIPFHNFPSDQQSIDMMLNSEIHEAFAMPYSSAEVAVAEALGRGGGAAETVDAAADRAVDFACADPDLRPALLSPEEPWPEPIIPSEDDPNPAQGSRQPLHAVRDSIDEGIARPPSIDGGSKGRRALSPVPWQSRGPQVRDNQVTRCEPDDYVDPVIT